MDCSKLPSGYLWTDKPSELWRVGQVFTWSPVFNQWIHQRYLVSIKPGETGEQAAKREDKFPTDSVVLERDM